ncbi:DNA/RNA non-specific endonuclease [Flavobacterium sp. NRK F7]|uniref:DNA/RNA non-specific endonuclease n=1 Tax=Flavobacterium sp. NRK F7 TaxID=2954930 RepID=UPI002090BB52|nr:DNA/RNA non-specific endonuclease [Flavobacterium sp. NRK F7]MCO6161882.1 DNA/RNA non-specific endonuclease [Flavobacterium sp. NRK F7]
MKKIFYFLFFLISVAMNAQKDPYDFSDLDNREKVISKAKTSSALQRNLLISEEFNGKDEFMNIVYITKEAAEKKLKIEERIIESLNQGKELSIQINPIYKGKSFVPEKIIIQISGDENFTEEILVW